MKSENSRSASTKTKKKWTWWAPFLSRTCKQTEYQYQKSHTKEIRLYSKRKRHTYIIENWTISFSVDKKDGLYFINFDNTIAINSKYASWKISSTRPLQIIYSGLFWQSLPLQIFFFMYQILYNFYWWLHKILLKSSTNFLPRTPRSKTILQRNSRKIWKPGYRTNIRTWKGWVWDQLIFER